MPLNSRSMIIPPLEFLTGIAKVNGMCVPSIESDVEDGHEEESIHEIWSTCRSSVGVGPDHNQRMYDG